MNEYKLMEIFTILKNCSTVVTVRRRYIGTWNINLLITVFFGSSDNKLMLKIFTKTSLSVCILPIIAILLTQIVAAQAPVKKNPAPTNPPKQAYPSNQVKTYPANNDLSLVQLITMQEAIKNSGYMRITEAKLTTYGEYAAKTGEYKTMYSNNRMIWMITGYVPGLFVPIKGRYTCIAGAKIVALVDAETGDSFGRSINCPPGNERSTMSIP